jgi:hypothetical protein
VWNDPINIVRCTVETHAEFHRYLWETFNHYEDYIAWRTLSGQMTMSEAAQQRIELGRERALSADRSKTHWSKGPNSAAIRKVISQAQRALGLQGQHHSQLDRPRMREIARQRVVGGTHPYQTHLGGRAKGKKKSKHMREKLSATMAGHTVSAATRKKIGDACRGRKDSEETRAKKRAFWASPRGKAISRRAGRRGAKARWESDDVRQTV